MKPAAPMPPARNIASETRAALRDLAGVGIGAVFMAFYATMIFSHPIPGILAFIALLSVGMPSLYRRLSGVATFTINSSFNLIGLGKLSEASRLLDDAEARPHFTWVRRLVDVQRAIIAMRLGNMAEARDRLDAAIARPLGIVARANSLYQIEGAYALRAFARASLGDREGALEDIAAVRSQGNASLDALAKVALAEALVLERAGERARLKELLDREETLLLEHTHPRERAIVRGLQRMLRASARGSIYRQTAPSEEPSAHQEEPPLADWVAKIAPDVAPFVRVPRRSTDGSPAMIAAGAAVIPRPAAVRAVAEAHAARARPRRSALLKLAPLAILGVSVVSVLFWALSSISIPTLPFDALVHYLGELRRVLGIVPLIALSIGGIAAVGLTYKKYAKRVRSRLSARGSGGTRVASVAGVVDASSARSLTDVASGPSDVAAAQARLVLASNAERSGDFAAVITECRLGIGRLVDPRSRAAADILYPDLIALCAFALAASGQSDEADAELALLGPTYPHHARAVFRVRLVQGLRRRDWAEAARWVEQGASDLPLSIREELLADIVRALHSPSQAGAGEIERIKDELRRSKDRRRWLDTVVPGIVTAFEQSGEVDAEGPRQQDRQVEEQPARVRVEVPAAGEGSERRTSPAADGSVADVADAAEVEARAEAEAEQASLMKGGAHRRGA